MWVDRASLAPDGGGGGGGRGDLMKPLMNFAWGEQSGEMGADNAGAARERRGGETMHAPVKLEPRAPRAKYAECAARV